MPNPADLDPADGGRRRRAVDAPRVDRAGEGRAAVGARRLALDGRGRGRAGSGGSGSSTTSWRAVERPATGSPRSRGTRASRHVAAPRDGRLEPLPGGPAHDVRDASRAGPSSWCSTRPIRPRSGRSRRASTSGGRCSSCRRKSGTTLEPNIFKQYFFERARQAVGADRGRATASWPSPIPARSSSRSPRADRFRHVFHGVPSIGGRYSALSDFGMVPAAFIGLDVARLLGRAQAMARACGADGPRRGEPRASRSGWSWACSRAAGATRSRWWRRRGSTTSAPGSSSSWPSRPARRARA